jgi:ABC-type Na+ transport system ATPase subunit NatA
MVIITAVRGGGVAAALFTLIKVGETVIVHKSLWTGTREVVVAVDAGSTVVAGRGAAGVQVNLTVLASELITADALVVIDKVKAGSSIEARHPQLAVIHVDVALPANKSWGTGAVEGIEEVRASCSIVARH